MLESKLKRRYTWPVELLGVIVEDGEVIIGTEEQIFPNGQINADFINLQHQQNRHLQNNYLSTIAPIPNAEDGNPDFNTISDSGNNECDQEEEITLGKVSTSSSARLLKLAAAGDNNYTSEALIGAENDKGEIESYTIYSPKLINIKSSHGLEQVDNTVCTCGHNSVTKTSGKSTNKHNNNNHIQVGGNSESRSAILGNCSDSGGDCSVGNAFFSNWSHPTTITSNAGANCYRESSNCSTSGRCRSNFDQRDEDASCNEILQVQISSLYPVTEEDVFTAPIESNADSSASSSCKKDFGTFQPIQGKFNFLRKKSRDSRKRKQEQQQQQQLKLSTSDGFATNTSAKTKLTINNSHKDYCPHSKVFQVKSVSPPDSSSGVISRGDVIRDSYYSGSVSGASSSNNNTPSHHSHLSSNQNSQSVSQCPQSDPLSLKIGTNCTNASTKAGATVRDGDGGRANGATCGNGTAILVGGGNLNCKSLHPETEGKIPSASGTATGAMALQVNTPNGDVKKVITLWQNYYPEGQWGWIIVFCTLIVQAINHGFQLSFSTFLISVDEKFHVGEPALLGLLGSFSAATSLFFSPLYVALCKSKSTRLAGVFGGLIAALGCLFTSFATEFLQLFISYGVFVGVGVGLTRDSGYLMTGQYFKKKRNFVEILVVSGSGVGILSMSVSVHSAIRSIGWRLGLQAVTGAILSTFFLGTCYRSASLYHPQRRAILHLKNQKRKVKDLAKREEKPPLIDYSCLKSKTLQILLLSSAFTAFGINSPLYYLSLECRNEPDPSSFVLLHMYLGAAWVIGCCLFGLIVVQKNQECRVSKQYLCQVASVICGISITALIVANGYSGLVIFVWVYGFSLGAYSYSLKVYTYERVRARHFARAWSFVQWSQAVPILVSIPLTGYLNENWGRFYGYGLSALSVFIGSASLFLTDVRRRQLSRKRAEKSSMKTCETLESAQSPKIRRLSFAFPVEQLSPQSKHDSGDAQGSQVDPALLSKELTCISEEGLVDMDFQDIYFEDWAEFLGGDITSCNKVENCLASEYDDFACALLLDRRLRRFSTVRSTLGFQVPGHASGAAGLSGQQHNILTGTVQSSLENNGDNPSQLPIDTLRIPVAGGPREIPVFKNHPWGNRPAPAQRSITVIDEASV